MKKITLLAALAAMTITTANQTAQTAAQEAGPSKTEIANTLIEVIKQSKKFDDFKESEQLSRLFREAGRGDLFIEAAATQKIDLPNMGLLTPTEYAEKTNKKEIAEALNYSYYSTLLINADPIDAALNSTTPKNAQAVLESRKKLIALINSPKFNANLVQFYPQNNRKMSLLDATFEYFPDPEIIELLIKKGARPADPTKVPMNIALERLEWFNKQYEVLKRYKTSKKVNITIEDIKKAEQDVNRVKKVIEIIKKYETA